MGYQQTQPTGRNEVPRPQGERESNLSETAKFVKGVMDRVVMPQLYETGLVVEANRIISQKLKPDAGEVIDFNLKCKQAEADCLERVSRDNPKEEAVVKNYFAKLSKAIQSPNEFA